MSKRAKTVSKRKKKALKAAKSLPDVVVIDSVQTAPSVSARLVEAVRSELVRLVAMPEHESNLGQIARFARAADDMLVIVKSPEAVMRDEHTITNAIATTTPAGPETYGASILRQLIPALQGYQKAQQETPEALVHAITLARRNGMTDVAAELEKKLTGKPLDGTRPVGSGIIGTLDSYLPPLTSEPQVETSNTPPKKNGKNAGVGSLPHEFTAEQRGNIFNEIARWLGIDGSPHEVLLISVSLVDDHDHEYAVTEIKDSELTGQGTSVDSVVRIVESAVMRDALTRFGDCVYVIYFHLAGGRMNRGRYPFTVPGSGHMFRGSALPVHDAGMTSRKTS